MSKHSRLDVTEGGNAPLRRRGDRVEARLPGIPISDRRHVVSLLQHIADRADYGQDLDILLTQLSPSTLDSLRQASVTDLSRLAEQRPAFISVCVDEQMMHLAMNRLQLVTKREEDALWFIKRGAPAAAMLELFGMYELEYRRLRMAASVETRRGRSPKLDNQTHHEVIRYWYRNRDHSDPIGRFKALGEAFPDASFSALWAAIRGGANS